MSNNTVPGSSFKVPGSGSQNPERRTENPEPIRFWRTRDELSGDAAFRERLHNEFPSEVEAITDETSRRAFMKLMGASIALAGLTACTRQPDEVIVPYVRQPEELIPGKPQFYATTMAVGGMVTGLLVESHEGRPTKIEGNPLHPESLGACDVFAQAAILGLYDPDRARTLSQLGEIRPWSAFLGAIRAAVAAQQPLPGQRSRDLARRVRAADVGVAVVDRDDLAIQRALDLLAGALCFRKLGHAVRLAVGVAPSASRAARRRGRAGTRARRSRRRRSPARHPRRDLYWG